MKKFNIFSILRNGKIFLLALAAWFSMSTSWAQDYLGFTATESGTTTVQLNKNGNPNTVSLQYRINEAASWTDYTWNNKTGKSISLSKGDKVEFKAKNTNSSFSKNVGYTYASTSFAGWSSDDDALTGNYYYFSFSNYVEGSGNVSTLLNPNGTNTLPDNAFAGLFKGCDKLLSAPTLPSTNLGEGCYAGMFYECTSLQAAPELPATTLKNNCYAYMFAGCEKLQSIKVGFTTWNTNATKDWVRTTKNGGSLITGTKTRHQFSATGGTFYKETALSFETGNDSDGNNSKIPTGWIIPTDKDYLLFSWNGELANLDWFTSLFSLFSDNEVSVTISLNPSDYLNQLKGKSGAQGIEYNKYFEDRTLEYSFSGVPEASAWTTWNYKDGATIKLKYGQSCFIRSKNSNPDVSSFQVKNSADRYLNFSISTSSYAKTKLTQNASNLGYICVTGNIMSLLDKNCTCNEVPEYGFYNLFKGVDCIFNAPTLPATDLKAHCYEGMFQGSTKLNAAPNLPATTEQIEDNYAVDCYKNMFNGCSKLDYMNVGFDKWNMTYYEPPVTENGESIPHDFTITDNWVNGVNTNDGTFRCKEGLSIEYGNSRIPTKWSQNGNVGAVEEKKDWLCFELTGSSGTVRLNRVGDISTLSGKLEYSIKEGADGTWDDYSWSGDFGKEVILNTQEGIHRVYFRSKLTVNNVRCSTSGQQYYQFKLDGNYNVSGNIMSLLHKDCERIDVNEYEFYNLFGNCKTIRTAPTLPATTLAKCCYNSTFYNCSSLLNPPELPAEILKPSCYYGLFSGCSSMTSAPALPATTLASSCYKSMFDGCISLTTAPTLPAEQLVNECYSGMFNGCTNLKSMDVYFTEWRDDYNATTNWVNGVDNSGVFLCPSDIWNDVKDGDILSNEDKQKYFNANRIPKVFTLENGTVKEDHRWTVAVNANTCLYFEAERNGSSIQLNKVGSPDVVYLIYSVNNGQTWDDYTIGNSIVLNKGQRIYFKAGKKNDDAFVTNPSFSKDGKNYYKFAMKGSFKAKGNIMSLLSKDNSSTSVSGYAFYYLFGECTALTSAPSLPATTLAKNCYYRIFEGCRNLKTPPSILPASNLEVGCYRQMFNKCYNLQTAPKIKATTLASNCCYSMFENCTSLTIAPELPATQLEKECYMYMFKGCSSLKYMNVGFTNWHDDATTDWVKDGSAIISGTTYTYPFPTQGIFICPEELPHATNNGNFGDSRIPKVDEDGKRWTINVVALQFVANIETTIALNKVGSPASVSLQYSTDNAQSWHDYTFTGTNGDTIRLKEDESLFIRSTTSNTSVFSKDANNYYQFSIKGSVSVNGSISSLLNKEADATTLPAYCFYSLFKDCEGLTNVPELPATTLGDYAYSKMFYNTSITEVDALIATTLGTRCYQSMFENCLALRKAPELNAETLSPSCYNSMFKGCTSLMEGPQLNATGLASNCYNSMFMNCSNLRIAPNLPATTLVSGCYANMFSGCSKLSEISVGFSDWSQSSATENWVKDVSDEGIFSCPNGLNTNTFGASNVPKDNNHKWEINPDFLGFKAATDATIALNKVGSPNAAYLIYSVNNKSKFNNKYTWDGQNGLVISLSAGESVYFKAENDYNAAETTDPNNPVPNKLSKDANNYYQFSITGSVAASGTVSYLLGRTTNNKEVPAYCFYKLFEGCTALTSAPAVSPNAKANAHAYESMFEGCSNITSGATELPATTVAEACYKNMFKGCEKMTTSPAALAATSVAESCYESMFEGDSLMTRIPTLGVSTTSAKAAYKNMFKGCKSLTSDNMPSKLMANDNTALSESVYEGMFEGCSSISNANIDLLSNNGFGKACYKNMFKGCTNLAVTPTSLLANSLSESCYESMFEGCESITTAPTMPVNRGRAVACYKAMFKGCKSLNSNIPSELGPGWGLQPYCFESMFEGCESLTTAPTLPCNYTPLAVGCYKAMFKGCTSLVSSALPSLNGRDLQESCYESMFENCTGLTTPAIQYPNNNPDDAHNLAKACFKNMYKGCSNLTSTPNTLNQGLKESCFEGMFENCTSLKTAPSLVKEELAEKCYYRMFAGCTSLTTAPDLPAKTANLKDSCYAYMFNGCINLHYIDVAFDSWKVEDPVTSQTATMGATYKWVENVAPAGTFMCPDLLKQTQRYGASYIPEGWSAEDNGDYLCFTAKTSGQVFLKRSIDSKGISYKYSFDKEEWHNVINENGKGPLYNIAGGTTIYFKKGDGELSKSTSDYYYFYATCQVEVSGNIMSLLDASMEQTNVPDYAFYKLFKDCANIQEISGLKMPATEVGAYAYANMFEGCTYLQNNSTVAPALPATTLGAYCYQNLFKNWKKLEAAPTLPAKTLAEGCYSNMFNGCSSLNAVSALPATELVANCYESMFADCAALDSLNVAFTEWTPASATNNWVSGVHGTENGYECHFVCPWALAQDAMIKSGNVLDDAYGPNMIPKDYYNPWLILLTTDMEFDYKTGIMTIAGRKPITYTTDPTLSVDNRIGTTVNEASTTVDLKDWLNDASITDLDSITYYAIAGESMNGGKIKPTVNKMTIYRYPKKIDMCICDNETRLKKAVYYANKVSSPSYPIKLFIPDGTYILDETLVISDSTISLIGESLDGTILKSSAPNGAFSITGDNVYMQDMKLVNTASGAAFTNRSLNTTMRVDIEGYYIEAPGGLESKRYSLPEASWDRATDPTQATIASVSLNGSTMCVTPGENNTSKYLIRFGNKYSFAPTKDFFIMESLEGKNVYIRAANARGAFGEPVFPDKIEANGNEYTELTIKLNGNGFSSFSFDDPQVDQLKVIGASVYKGVYHEGAVYLTRLNEHDIVPRRTGVILAGLPNATLQLYLDNTHVDQDPYSDVTGDNIPLVGNCNEGIQRQAGDGKYYYGLSGNVFKKLSDKGIVKPNKAFFDLTGKVETNAASIRIVFGMWEEEEEEVVSGINYLPTSGDDSEYSYTLTGVRMKEAKGLVIQNNKVVLVK